MNVNSEIFRCIKSINIDNITDGDKSELLSIFKHTENPLIRNHIALVFSDLEYSNAVPYIIKKIMSKSTYNDNGTLVYALDNLASKDYFTSFIKMICDLQYESRLQAYGIIENLINDISSNTRNRAVRILEVKKKQLNKQKGSDKGENSTLHFVEKTMELLKKSSR